MGELNTSISGLQKYLNILRQVSPNFPDGCCYESSIILEYFEELKSVSGYFVPKGEEENKSKWVEHYWNESPQEGLEYDITQHQFEGIESKITVNRIGEGRLIKDERVNDRFKDNIPNLQDYAKTLIQKIAS